MSLHDRRGREGAAILALALALLARWPTRSGCSPIWDGRFGLAFVRARASELLLRLATEQQLHADSLLRFAERGLKTGDISAIERDQVPSRLSARRPDVHDRAPGRTRADR